MTNRGTTYNRKVSAPPLEPVGEPGTYQDPVLDSAEPRLMDRADHHLPFLCLFTLFPMFSPR